MNTQTLATAAALVLTLGTAQAIDVRPADCIILPSGTKVGNDYWQRLSSDSLSMCATEVAGWKLDADIVIRRSRSNFNMGNMPAALPIVAPFGSICTARVGGAGQATRSCLGCVTVGPTIWPVQPKNPETGNALGFSLFATLPTGDQDPASIGIAAGTTTITPQMGIIQGLGNGWYFDGVLDVDLHADHDESGVTHERDPSWRVQTMLHKQWEPATSLTISYSGQRGGDQIIGGIKTRRKSDRDQIRLYCMHFLSLPGGSSGCLPGISRLMAASHMTAWRRSG